MNKKIIIFLIFFSIVFVFMGCVSANDDLNSTPNSNMDYSKNMVSCENVDIYLSSENADVGVNLNNIEENNILSANNKLNWYVNGTVVDSGNGSSNSPYKTLNEVIENKNLGDGDTIFIAPGIYKGIGENINLNITKSLNIVNWTSGDVIFDAQGQSRIFKVTSSTINITGLTFINGTSDSGGAAIMFVNSIHDSNIFADFIANNGNAYGTPLYFNGFVNNCNFKGNYRDNIQMYGPSIMSFNRLVTNSNFEGNFSDNFGYDGAITFYADVMDCKFSGNFIANMGYSAAITFLTMANNCTFNGYFSENSAYNGASIYAANFFNSIINASFIHNIGTESGSVLDGVNAINCTLTGIFINNTGSNDASAFHFAGDLINSTISGFYLNNWAYHGAIHYILGVTDNCDISGIYINNRAAYGGVVIFNDISNTNISGIYINNSALHYGGSLYFRTNVYNCSITGIFINNSAVEDAGAIYAKENINNTFIHDAYFENNRGVLGNVIYIIGDHSVNLTIVNSTFLGTNSIYPNREGNNESYIYLINNTELSNPGNYFIYNKGNLYLCNNNLTTAIYNAGNITSYTNVTIMDNTTKDINSYLVQLYAKIYDDNNNFIVEKSFTFSVNGDTIETTFDKNGYANCSYAFKDVGEHVINSTMMDSLKNNEYYISILKITSGIDFEGTTFSEFQELIDNCKEGDIINLKNDVTFDGFMGMTIDKSLLINGNNHSFDAKGQSMIFSVTADNVIFNDITFKNANENRYCGGAIKWQGDNGYVNNCTFINNVVSVSTYPFSGRGGAIYWTGEDGTIINSYFFNNTAYEGGGVSWNADNGVLINSTFIANNAIVGGGAVCWYDNGINGKILDCDFINNSVISYGGAIFLYSNNASIRGCVFESNVGDEFGGAVYSSSNNAIITDSIFRNNMANVSGAIYWYMGDNGIISNSVFENNMANVSGAIYWYYGGNGIISNSTFENNTGDFRNIYANVDWGVDLDVLNSTFRDAILTLNVSGDINPGQNETICGTVDDGTYLNQTFELLRDGNEWVTVDVADGAFSYIYENVSAGIYNLALSNVDTMNNTYGYVTPKAKFSSRYVPNISVENPELYVGDDLIIDVPVDTTANVTLVIGDNNYTATPNDGKAIFNTTGINPNNYMATIIFDGDANYENVSITQYINLIPKIKIIAPDLVKYYGGTERFEVTVTDGKGTPLGGKNVNITINHKSYYKITDSLGKCSLNIKLNSGNYSAAIKVDDVSFSSLISILTTLNGSDITKVYKNDTQYWATFLDDEGNYLAIGSKVRFNINGVFYDRIIMAENGLAKLNINLIPGTYIITAYNLVTGEMSSNNITVLSHIIDNKDLVKYYKNDSQYVVRIIGDDGNVVGANEKVIFNINGVMYERYTNETGHVKLNINLGPGTYIITSMYKSSMVSNKITVLPKIIASDLIKKFANSDEFKAKIVDGTGQIVSGANVNFNINGVFYNRTSDGNGVASLSINLIPGEYIITSSYGDSSVGNKITILS
ncbi:hypothetical protein [uncultured Methanobrevibacter sp.]|uniref:hypothetical protein n=1 Tax=uncultured Methanobrevibacter sp. TaxID=253161 RepID=UPI0025D8F212|nr:hypothetical protein [uncultured Methanobrevibacter sp.]